MGDRWSLHGTDSVSGSLGGTDIHIDHCTTGVLYCQVADTGGGLSPTTNTSDRVGVCDLRARDDQHSVHCTLRDGQRSIHRLQECTAEREGLVA